MSNTITTQSSIKTTPSNIKSIPFVFPEVLFSCTVVSETTNFSSASLPCGLTLYLEILKDIEKIFCISRKKILYLCADFMKKNAVRL